jgi:hypothetical protein
LQRRHILAIIDRQVGFPVRLVGSEGAPGHRGENAGCDGLQAGAFFSAIRFVLLKAPLQAPVAVVEVEGAVLTHHGVDRPHPRNVIAPARRPPGHRHDAKSGCAQLLERPVGFSAELAIGSHGVVDIGEHGRHAARVEL